MPNNFGLSVARVIAVLIACGACGARPSLAPNPVNEPDSTNAAVVTPQGSARTATTRYRFYTGKDYGSEAQFNPLSEILNEGFDVLSTRGQDRHIFSRNLGGDVGTVWHSLTHADQVYRNYGFRHFVRNEVLPLELKRRPGAGAWLPNYQSHLFGSGMVSWRMREWFDYHGYPMPGLLAAATVMTAHFANEVVENNGMRILNEDATTDLLLFDLGGIALWHAPFMQRAFSGSFRLTNWPGQPAYNPSSQTLENTGQVFVLHGPLPNTTDWRFFYLFGMAGVGGVTRNLGGGNAISVGFGVDAIENPVTDAQLGTKTATLRPKASVYFDRDGSLLWSLSAGAPGGAVSWLTANVYPGVVRVGRVSPGFWMQLPKDGGVRLGLVSTLGLGLGAGSAR